MTKIQSDQYSSNGWIPDPNTWTFSSSDAPTYIVSINADVTAYIGLGMRIKVADSGEQMGIVTAVGAFGGGVTLVTIYCGTEFALSGGAITLPYYSREKAPFGFPLDPLKWTVEVTDTTNRVQATPTQSVWYNLGSFSISIPIGAWNTSYKVILNSIDSTSSIWQNRTTLSTSNNSESDTDFTILSNVGNVIRIYITHMINKNIILSSKTTYYLNQRTIVANLDNMYIRGDYIPTLIRAVCAYL